MEQHNAQPSNVKQNNAKPSNVGQNNAKPSNVKQNNAKPSNVGQNNVPKDNYVILIYNENVRNQLITYGKQEDIVEQCKHMTINEFMREYDAKTINSEFKRINGIFILDSPREYTFFNTFMVHLINIEDTHNITIIPNPRLLYAIESKAYYKKMIRDNPDWFLPTYFMVVHHPGNNNNTAKAIINCPNWQENILKWHKQIKPWHDNNNRYIEVEPIDHAEYILKSGFTGHSSGINNILSKQDDIVKHIVKYVNNTYTVDTYLGDHKLSIPVLCQPKMYGFGDIGHHRANNNIRQFINQTSIAAIGDLPKEIDANEYRFFFHNDEFLNYYSMLGKYKMTVKTNDINDESKYISATAKVMALKVYEYVRAKLFKNTPTAVCRIDIGFLVDRERKYHLFLNEVDLYPGGGSTMEMCINYEYNPSHPNKPTKTLNEDGPKLFNLMSKKLKELIKTCLKKEPINSTKTVIDIEINQIKHSEMLYTLSNQYLGTDDNECVFNAPDYTKQWLALPSIIYPAEDDANNIESTQNQIVNNNYDSSNSNNENRQGGGNYSKTNKNKKKSIKHTKKYRKPYKCSKRTSRRKRVKTKKRSHKNNPLLKSNK